MSIVAVSGPSAEPISLAEAKLHCKVDSDLTADDTLLSGLIIAARQHVEHYTHQVLVRQAFRGYLPNFQCRIDLLHPLRSVSAINYLDTSNALQTLDTSVYVVDQAERPPCIYQAYSQVWPPTWPHPQAVKIDFVAGHVQPYTANASTDTLSAPSHGYSNGDLVRLSNSGGAVPAGLAVGTNYYVVGAAADTLQLSATSGGAAINLTDAGTGSNFLGEVPRGMLQAMLLIIGTWYANREAVITGRSVAAIELPLAVDALLNVERVWGEM